MWLCSPFRRSSAPMKLPWAEALTCPQQRKDNAKSVAAHGAAKGSLAFTRSRAPIPSWLFDPTVSLIQVARGRHHSKRALPANIVNGIVREIFLPQQLYQL